MPEPHTSRSPVVPNLMAAAGAVLLAVGSAYVGFELARGGSPWDVWWDHWLAPAAGLLLLSYGVRGLQGDRRS